MMDNFLATRLAAIKPSPTIAMTARAAALKSAGKNILSLSAGEPDLPTPPHIIDAANDAMRNGKTKYTSPAGLPEFRAAICRKLLRDNHLNYQPDDIHVGVGGKEVIALALMASLNQGDEVIILSPYWVSYIDLTQLFGGVAKIIIGHEKNNFKITAEQLHNAITPKTKWLFINNPSNPTGMGYKKSELIMLGQVLQQHPNIMVMSDEIYEFLIYDDFEFTAFATACPEISDRVLTVNGLSKSYAMTGWRVGYGAGRGAVISPLIKAMNMLQSQLTSSTSTISQWAGVAALDGDHSFLKTYVTKFQERRDFLFNALMAIKGITLPKPEGAFYLYPSVKFFIGKKTKTDKIINNDDDLCEYLLERAGVATVAGSAFGLSPYIRLSYATSMEILQEAATAITVALAELQ